MTIFEEWFDKYWPWREMDSITQAEHERMARVAYIALVTDKRQAKNESKPIAPITISVWAFKDAPRALRDLATPFAAPPTNESLVVYVPARTSVGLALQLLSLPDEDHGETQIVALPDGAHCLLAERS